MLDSGRHIERQDSLIEEEKIDKDSLIEKIIKTIDKKSKKK